MQLYKYGLFLNLFLSFYIYSAGGITYGLSGGRFGDNILAYARAALIAHRLRAPLLYTPFPSSDQLQLHTHVPPAPLSIAPRRLVTITDGILNSFSEHKWYKIAYCPTIAGLYEAMVFDEQFAEKVKNHLKPIKELTPLPLPSNRITVAVHVRKGGGKFDDYRIVSPVQFYTQQDINNAAASTLQPALFSDQLWPLKFPPDQYYVDQIIQLSEMLDNMPMHVHIFTDDVRPEELVRRYSKYIAKDTITYSYQEHANHSDGCVLEDFFAMAYQFDCLIRSGSNFSWASQLIGNHKIIIAQESGKWIGDILVVDKISITFRQPTCFKQYILSHFPLSDDVQKRLRKNSLTSMGYSNE
jgi:hypothetical protein